MKEEKSLVFKKINFINRYEKEGSKTFLLENTRMHNTQNK